MSVFLKRDYPTKWIPVGDMSVVMVEAQRSLSRRKVERLKEEFDPNAFGALAVCKPNGREHYHIIDGQHRATAIREMYGDGERVPCIVIPAKSVEEAAESWLKINSDRAAPQALDKFNVGVVAGRTAEVVVNEIIVDAGFRVDVSSHDGCFAAVGSALKIYTQYGPEVLRETLRVITRAWGHKRDAVTNGILKGVAKVLHDHEGEVDANKLADKISKSYTPASLTGAAKTAREMFRGSVSGNVATCLVQTYNHGLRTNRLES